MAIQTDPVCGMQVDEQMATNKSQYQGTDYYFCSADCKREFDQQPEQYVVRTQQGGQARGGAGNR